MGKFIFKSLKNFQFLICYSLLQVNTEKKDDMTEEEKRLILDELIYHRTHLKKLLNVKEKFKNPDFIPVPYTTTLVSKHYYFSS